MNLKTKNNEIPTAEEEVGQPSVKIGDTVEIQDLKSLRYPLGIFFRVVGTRNRFGSSDLEVEPVSGTGKRWVKASTVKRVEESVK
jgi:hypothetical protein